MDEKTLKILVINYEYPPIGGGGGVICRDVAEEMASMGHEVVVITTHYHRLKREETLNGVKIIRVPVLLRKDLDVATIISMLSYVPSAIKTGIQLLNRKRFDVVNTHFAIPSGPAGQYLAKRFNLPNVLSIHGGDIFDPSKSLSPHNTSGLKQIVKKMLLNADRVVAQSSDTKRNALHYYDIRKEIDIIPLGIKPNRFALKERKNLDLPEDKVVFSTIGRLIKRKNLEELLEILSTIQSNFPFLMLIIGEGPEREHLQTKIRSLGLIEKVRLLGRVSEEEKFQYLNLSDAYLSTAMHEGFGIVFLEAMECGVPVICYDRGGQVDFLQNGKTGFLIQSGDKEAFASNLLRLLNNSQLREEMSRYNRDYISSFYISNIAKKYVSYFKGVLDGDRKQSDLSAFKAESTLIK
ncbi:MAG: glycosyltransferase [Aliifodinibius sp.]|nr:glycosyltransferase family 4 protein [Fodinibius sp.]NIV10094.1 glycosyltransferase [Fodinibius sp.]NIY23695.1 glycosyltransferase [Fodinibius sp.]